MRFTVVMGVVGMGRRALLLLVAAVVGCDNGVFWWRMLVRDELGLLAAG